MPTPAWKNIPGLPFVGSLPSIATNPQRFFNESLRRHGDRLSLRVLGRNVVLTSDPAVLEQVLVRDKESFGRSRDLKNLRAVFGEGLLVSEGASWQRQRHSLQPAFSRLALARYAATMRSVAQARQGEWRDGDVIDVHAAATLYSRDVICEVLFGREYRDQEEDVNEAVTAVFSNLRSEILYLPLWRKLPFERSRRWNRGVQVFQAFIRRAVADARRRQSSTTLLGSLLTTVSPDAHGEQELMDQIQTFFIAGHETAALGLAWSLYLLARHPEVQDRVWHEVRGLQDNGDPIDAVDQMLKLRWTNAVVKEALRLYPPVWTMGRRCLRQTELAGKTIEPDTAIWMCIDRLHHDERWFTNADSFCPERWVEGWTAPPFTYLPFGMGPHICIGQHFAMMEMVIGLARAVRQFRLDVVSRKEPKLNAWITLRPALPLKVLLHTRNSA